MANIQYSFFVLVQWVSLDGRGSNGDEELLKSRFLRSCMKTRVLSANWRVERGSLMQETAPILHPGLSSDGQEGMACSAPSSRQSWKRAVRQDSCEDLLNSSSD